jgi:hypothetical protein
VDGEPLGSIRELPRLDQPERRGARRGLIAGDTGWLFGRFVGEECAGDLVVALGIGKQGVKP